MKRKVNDNMIRVYDFRCTNGHVFENFVGKEVTVSRCGCGADAKRIISPIRTHLDGSDPGFPGAAMKWEREHERAAKAGKSHED